jgi:hypothetical protein
MALRLGAENKRQVYLAIVLFAIVFCLVGWRVYRMISGPAPRHAAATVPAAAPKPQAAGANSPAAAAPEAQKLTTANINPVLHFDNLAQSEDVEYAGRGRNIFSAQSAPAPVAIPKPVKSGRATGPGAAAPSAVPAVPRPPSIDLRYFGYTEGANKSLHAFLIHGEDVFMARAGDVVDHRYKVVAIRPTSVQVTDLAYNNTQTLTLAPF